eukprot:EG_transcript_6703
MAALRKATKLGELASGAGDDSSDGTDDARPGIWDALASPTRSKERRARRKKKAEGTHPAATRVGSDAAADGAEAMGGDPGEDHGKPRRAKSKKLSTPSKRTDACSGDGSLDDSALEELLAAHCPPTTRCTADPTAALSPRQRLLHALECSADHLDAEAETRRKFGRHALEDVARQRPSTKQRRPRKFRRSLFVQPDEGWPPWTDHGLRLELVCSPADLPQAYAFVLGPEGRRAQDAYESVGATHDHTLLSDVLQRFPYHVPTLLQLSLVLEMHDHLQQSRDLLHRAIYTLEIVANSAGFPWLSPARQRTIPHAHSAENRLLHEALWRHVHALSRSGCHRTALEVGKVLYGLDPDRDPMHCLLLLDYLCLRAAEWQYLQHLTAALEAGGSGVHALPGLQFGGALAAYLAEVSARGGLVAEGYGGDARHGESLAALTAAILTHPMQVTVLLQKLDVLDSDVLTHSLFSEPPDSALFQNLLEIYADRNAELWKRKDVVAWLLSGVHAAVRELQGDAVRSTRLKANRQAVCRRPCFQPYGTATSDAILGRVVRLPDDDGPPDAAHPPHPLRVLQRLVWAPRNPLLLFLASLLPWNTVAAMLHHRLQAAP